jgi:sugar-specific transcriptional regulator TrmB
MSEDSLRFPAGLENFGLSDYEARTYTALLQHGSLLVSELAFHAQIPRTKTYAAVKALVRKNLATILPGKPVRCHGVRPEESLERILSQEEKKLRAMKKTVLKLRQMGEEMRKPHDVVESKHLTLGANILPTKIPELVSSSKISIRCIVDNWGFSLLQAAREPFLNVTASGVEVQVIRLWGPEGLGLDQFLSEEFDVKICKQQLGHNIFLFDDSGVLLVERVTGKGLLISSREMNRILKESLFDDLWSIALPVRSLEPIAALKGSEDVLELLNADAVKDAFIRAVSSVVTDMSLLETIGLRFTKELESTLNVELFKTSADVAIPVLTTLLLQSLGEGGSVRFDPLTNLLNVEAPAEEEGIPCSVWMFAIAGLLRRNETPLSIIQNISHPEDGTHILQAKITGTRQ